MARNRADVCMFCDQLPCRCGKPPREPKAPRAPKTEPSRPTFKQPVQQIPVKVPSKVPGGVQAVKIDRPQPVAPVIKEIRSQEEVDMRNALTALADAELLCAEDLAKHKAMIDLPSWRIEALIWRQS